MSGGRGIRAAAWALGALRREGRRVAAPDEDEFTLSVLAAEQLERAVGSPAAERVHLFGRFAPEAVRDLPVALGAPRAVIAAHADTAEELLEVVASESETSRSGEAILLAAEVSGRAEGEGGEARDVGAVALRIGDPTVPLSPGSPEGREGAGSLRLGTVRTALGAAADLSRESHALANPSAPESGEPRTTPEPRIDLHRLSEGAYVPRPRYLENLPSRWRFAADRCTACGTLNFPPRGFCRRCGSSERLDRVELPRSDALVEAVTTVHSGAQPTEFDWMLARGGSYDVLLVRLAAGVRVTLQGADAPAGTWRPGRRVDTVLRRLYPMEGEWRYGRKAVVPLNPSASSPPA